MLSILPGMDVSHDSYTKGEFAYSGVSLRMNSRSMAAENAAKAKPPPSAAFGPEFRARTPPAMNPDATELYISFLARYYEGSGNENDR
jgi:hypothetical protein